MKSKVIATIKEANKALALEIRTTRLAFKEAQRSGTRTMDLFYKMHGLAYQYRHRHIAYCLLRGRTMEQIERVSYNLPDEEVYKAHLKTWQEELKKEEEANAVA